MSLEPQIRRLEQDVAQAERVAQLNQRILGELMKSTPPPASLETARGYLRSANDLLKRTEQEAAEKLVGQALEGLEAVRQWLAVGDLGISPFVLRTFLEKNNLNGELRLALVRYFLAKQPHAENDRDKLDYLITSYFGAGALGQMLSLPAERLRGPLGKLFEGIPQRELGPAAEMMLHELESLIAHIGDFTDFDQLVQARLVERARAVKINLGEDFSHQQVLPSVIRFNLTFRRHFDHLFHQQLSTVRQTVRQRIEEAWTLTRAIEAACETLALPQEERAGLAVSGEAETDSSAQPRLGRPLDVLDERPPIDRLVRRGEEPQKEAELRGIIGRLARFLNKLPADQAQAEKVLFPLRVARLELARWEREAFVPTAAGSAPESTGIIQYALGVLAWLQEELARYHETRHDRYIWKTHFDFLSYAVVRAVDLLKAIRELVRKGAPPAEAAWFGPLLQTALRLASTLNQVAPVFTEPDEPDAS